MRKLLARTFTFTRPVNPVCARRGHRAGAGTWDGAPAPFVECRRCGRRPLWFGSLSELTAVVAAVPDGGYSQQPRIQWFRDVGHYDSHVERGRQVLWPEDLLGFTYDGEEPRDVERVRVEVIYGGQLGLGASLRLDGKGAETPLDLAVQLGPVGVYASTSELGSRVAGRVVPDGESRTIAAGIYAGERLPDSRAQALLDTAVRLELWRGDGHKAGQWRDGYWTPVRAVVDAALGPQQYTGTTIGAARPVTLRLPEGDHPATVALHVDSWTRARRRRGIVRWFVRCTADVGVDDGHRRIAEWTVPVTDPTMLTSDVWVAHAVAESTRRFLLARATHHGPDWTPQEE